MYVSLPFCHHGIFSFPRGSGEFGHGQGRGPWQRGEDTPVDESRGDDASLGPVSGYWYHCGESAMGWVGVQSLGTGEQGAPAGPPKRRPARKSLLIPCVAKTLAVFWQTFSLCGGMGRCRTIGGKQKTCRGGQVRWRGRYGRSGRYQGICWDITMRSKWMATDRFLGCGPAGGRRETGRFTGKDHGRKSKKEPKAKQRAKPRLVVVFFWTAHETHATFPPCWHV